METKFVLREDHLKLARRAHVGWCDDETGAPEIDPKRPYGNSDVPRDVAEIIGEPLGDEGDHGFDESAYEDACDRMMGLHREMVIAVQLILGAAGEAVDLGVYERENAWSAWRYVGPEGLV